MTVFAVRGDRLLRIETLGSGGAFPVSVATHGALVYVLNARNGGTVQRYVRVGDLLVRVPSWNRALGLDATQTPEFTSTPGQVAFTPDGSKLVVTTKGNGSAIDVFAVNRLGALSPQPVKNVETGAVPFAVAFDAGGHLVVAEAGTNAVATFSIRTDGTLALVASQRRARPRPAGSPEPEHPCSPGTPEAAAFPGSVASARGGSGARQTPIDMGTVDVGGRRRRQLPLRADRQGGIVDAFRIGAGGSRTAVGSVVVPNGAGGEGIAAP